MIRQGERQRMTFFCPFCQPRDPANPPARPPAPPPTRFTNTVRTLADARDFVLSAGMCGIAHDPKGKLPTLWDALAFEGTGPDAWGEKLVRVWAMRQQLAAKYPNQIFTGRVKGGRVVLMSVERLRAQYARDHRELEQCSALAQQLFAIVEQGPVTALALRQSAGLTTRKDRSRFDRALQELQTSFNIARLPSSEGADLWVPFLQQYPEFAANEGQSLERVAS
jgi:hypothetical protein